MTTVLINELAYAGRYFPAGTVITPKGAPASGGYFLAMAELDDRSYLVSVRDVDVATLMDSPEQVELSAPVTDVNENEITVGARVEYVGPDLDLNGSTGRVEEIVTTGGAVVACVEFDSHLGDAYDILPTHLAVYTLSDANGFPLGIG